MRTQRLSDPGVKKIAAPATGNRIHYDDIVPGFGVRVTANGARAYVFNYRSKATANYGTERRITIGDAKDWKAATAREYARDLRRQVDTGRDPLGERKQARDADTVAD